LVSAFDPRTAIRTAIGYERYVNGVDRSTVSVSDDRDDTVYIPLLLPHEVHTGDVPEMPYVEMKLMNVPSYTENIGGDVHFTEAYIDFDIVFTDQDHITPSTFGANVTSEILDKVMENRHSITNCIFAEVVNDGREIYERISGYPIVFHRLLELKCIFRQKKT